MSVEAADGKMPKGLHYKKADGLSGTILFYHTSGALANGWSYVEGKLGNQISAVTKVQYEAQLKAQHNGAKGKTMAMVQHCQSGWAQRYQWACVSAGNASPTCNWIAAGTTYVTHCVWKQEEETIDFIAPENDGGGFYIPPIYEDCGACPPKDVIIRDTSITNNPKINCLLNKLLGSGGNSEIKALLDAFTGQGFDVTFKIGTMQDSTSKGETGPDPNNPTKYNIALNRNMINTETQMSWVKVLLHEAFHANLMQKTYKLFGNTAVGLWDKKPGGMSIDELMDYTSMKAASSGDPVLFAEHHYFMAMNIDVIKNGLKSFSLANNLNHSDFNDDHFTAMAYEGLNKTSYYLNNVIKDSNGNNIMVFYSGQNRLLSDVHGNRSMFLTNNSVIPCN